MTPLSRTTSLLATRIGLVMVVMSLAVLGAWTAGDLLGQLPDQEKIRDEQEDAPKAKPPAGKKKRIEEEEEAPPKKQKRKVIEVEAEEPPKTKTEPKRPALPATSSDLAQLEKQATHPALKGLFHALKVPHDRVLYKRSNVTHSGERSQLEENIEPIPLLLGDDPGRWKEVLNFRELTTVDWQPVRTHPANLKSLESVRPYEKIAQDKVLEFLHENFDTREPDNRLYLSRYDMLDAAEKALSAVLRWHESARQTGKRKGDEWNDVEKKLRGTLLDEVKLEQMKWRTQAKDWNGVREMTRDLTRRYTEPAERDRILRPVADMINAAIKVDDPIRGKEAKKLACKFLLELDREYPDNSALRPLKEQLQDEAKSYLKAADEARKDKDIKKAQQYLQRAEDTWPQLPELRSARGMLDIEHPKLLVGVRGPLPKYFSPAWACTDNERRAVDMLFEGLIKLVPDKSGGYRYCRGLSESQPKVVPPLGRQFELPHGACWTDQRPLNSTDIDFSLKLLQAGGQGVGRSHAWGELLKNVESGNDPFQVTLRLNQGFLDPLASMTFKILPRDLPVTEEVFALNPVTSGPFRLDRSQQSDESKRECVFFLANPNYGGRWAKHNRPNIQEVRFYSYSPKTIADDLGTGKLDLVLDLTAKEAEELLKKQRVEGLPIEAPLPSPGASNRRIYFLAVNTRKLDDANLRQALSYAIDREALLDKHFRVASLRPPLHKALSGPFPVGSWACKPAGGNADAKAGRPLFDADAAKTSAQQPAVVEAIRGGALKLKYPQGDPDLEAAMTDLCEQVQARTGIVLKPTPLSPYQLQDDVEVTKNYDLAYYHYDFPDQTYWLAPLFAPPPRANDGKNMFKFYDAKLTQLLDGTKTYRDFATVKEYQRQTHVYLNKQMPFIPLWQLDPLLAYRNEVKPVGLDPLWVFRNIEEWHLVRK